MEEEREEVFHAPVIGNLPITGLSLTDSSAVVWNTSEPTEIEPLLRMIGVTLLPLRHLLFATAFVVNRCRHWLILLRNFLLC
ncbi:hypothetical protein QQG55_47460 [Brugia pahangi]